MHILIVNFGLKGTNEEEYRGIAETIAPAFANMTDLISKTWLANAETNTYGGVYAWRSREAMEAYKRSDIFEGVLSNPHFVNVKVQDFKVLEDPTRVTRGSVAA